jgi:large subunit ribosomal protein L12
VNKMVDPYVHAVLVLYGAGKQINVENLKKVLESAGVAVDEAKVKVLVEAVSNVNIEEAISKSSQVAVAPVAAPTEQKKEEKKEEKKQEADTSEALAALFG